MFGYRFITICCVLLVSLICAGAGFGQTPSYQPIPSQVIASGIADVSGPGGTAYIEYWVWDGGNSYYYYSYRIHNSAFQPYVKHLTIGNPTGELYIVTGSSGGGPAGGTAWSYATHASLPTLVDWVASDPNTVVYPGQDSWESSLFQFASKLAPSSAPLTVRQGDLTVYAAGLIPAPGGATSPESSGYWKHQYSGKGNRKEASSLPGYMNNIEIYSDVFKTDLAGSVASDLAFGTTCLCVPDNSDMRDKARKELFALWLNIVSQKLNYYAPIAYDIGAVTTTATTVAQAMDEIEATILNANATLQQLENAKDMAEILNCQ